MKILVFSVKKGKKFAKNACTPLEIFRRSPRGENMSQFSDYIQRYPIIAIKTGTETEDMGEQEIALLQKIFHNLLPVYVKIGGPEARNDMRICQRIGVAGISAPMIESEYAFKNFITSLKNVVSPIYYKNIRKAINLETITGYRNLLEILDNAFTSELDQITAARSDLSSSMNLNPDDKEVTRITRNIVSLAKSKNIKTGVGGTITKMNFDMIREEIQPDFINSRHIMVDVSKMGKISGEEMAESMLSMEMELYEIFAKAFPEKAFYYKNRIETNRERIGERKILYFLR